MRKSSGNNEEDNILDLSYTKDLQWFFPRKAK